MWTSLASGSRPYDVPVVSRPTARVIDDPHEAASTLRRGGLVGVPTETVYGLAADATNPTAVRRVFAVKGRPVDHPLILHLGAAAQLGDWVADVPPAADTLAGACWPGPLTLLLWRRHDRVLDEVTGGRDTVAVRVPAHPLTLATLDELGGPVVAPSANRFGSVSPTQAGHVVADLGDRLDPSLDVVLDGGECAIGVESTIVDLTGSIPEVLRPGAIPINDLESLVGHVIGPAGSPPADPSSAETEGEARASGMLASHYAPRARVLLVDDAGDAQQLLDEQGARGRRVELLDVDADDLIAYARDLYAALRQADDRDADVVVAVLPPPRGLGLAIRDRLTKASAARLDGA